MLFATLLAPPSQEDGMGARWTEMHRLQEVVRLCRMGQSAQVIARRLSIDRNTITRYLEALEREGLLEGRIDELPEVDVLRACPSRRT